MPSHAAPRQMAQAVQPRYQGLDFYVSEARRDVKPQGLFMTVKLQIINRTWQAQRLNFEERLDLQFLPLYDQQGKIYKPSLFTSEEDTRLDTMQQPGAVITLELKYQLPLGAQPSYLEIDRGDPNNPQRIRV
jgi:hypothetical protein